MTMFFRACGKSKFLSKFNYPDGFFGFPWKKTTSKIIFQYLFSSALLVTLTGCVAGLINSDTVSSGLDRPAITTSLSDAASEVPSLDNFNPPHFQSMLYLPRGPKGEFYLKPGAYEYTAWSYCLHAGTYGPRGGDGYIYAPLKGPRADIIRKILQNSVSHREIPQRNIQVLIWAVLARTKISNMSREAQLAAAKLLTPEEILEVNGGALGLIPDSVKEIALERMPPLLRQAYDAERRLRSLLNDANSTYEEMERAAVLIGDSVRGAGSRDVPKGRWSSHPGGFYIRYLPDGYSKTKIQVYVPEKTNATNGKIMKVAYKKESRMLASLSDAGSADGLADAGSADAGAADSGPAEGVSDGGAVFDPSGDVAQPGDTSRQRLAQSGKSEINLMDTDLAHVVCDGHGGYKADNWDKTITKKCTQKHEQTHIDDLKSRFGNKPCEGVHDLFRPEYDISDEELTKFEKQSECNAYKVSVKCLEELNKTELSSEDKKRVGEQLDSDKYNECVNCREKRNCSPPTKHGY